MSRFQTSTSNDVVTQARDAYTAGRTVFTPVLQSKHKHHNASYSPPEWAEMIEGIESAGWVLQQWAVTSTGSTLSGTGEFSPAACPLFRRSN